MKSFFNFLFFCLLLLGGSPDGMCFPQPEPQACTIENSTGGVVSPLQVSAQDVSVLESTPTIHTLKNVQGEVALKSVCLFTTTHTEGTDFVSSPPNSPDNPKLKAGIIARAKCSVSNLPYLPHNFPAVLHFGFIPFSKYGIVSSENV